ncbi:arylamine N-acetyltransferase family protein [Neolewinella antarctica]|uniref:N-hydroxyarylamine O-acetyltransferase n=1 Tax=Neolewinella antarctica TaxID=442734 RepID=A0ABX0X9W9_9BACT|nr:arylamine N-acetyltransferase [Neolewinella antarctica]NJC25623.1 N-hydroxyarylamine O-acetyltransferase [Neolewinella antarctica]
MNDSKITDYLNRIKVNDFTPGLAGLTKLQERHLENIPFENLDIPAGRRITLDHDHLFNKIVQKNRGGYCFELNTLYAELLKSLGFTPKPVLARVWLSNPKKLPPRNHLAYLVELDGRTYLTDVGFGGLVTRVPLDINVSVPVSDKDGLVRIAPVAGQQFMVQRKTKKGWASQYSFENVEVSEEDIEIANYYMSTNPRSHFCRHLFVGKLTQDGRIGLFNNKLSFRKGIKKITTKRIDFGEDWLAAVRNEFSLNPDFSGKELTALFYTDPD